MQRRMLGFNQIKPLNIYIRQRPRILKSRPCSLTANRSRVVGLGIEGGIQIDQVNRRRVYPPKDEQVIPGPDSFWPEIYGCVGGYLQEQKDPQSFCCRSAFILTGVTSAPSAWSNETSTRRSSRNSFALG